MMQNTEITRSPLHKLLIIFVFVLLGFGGCFYAIKLTSSYLISTIEDGPFTKTYNLETTEMLIQFLKENPATDQPSGELGERLQSVQYFLKDYIDCREFLQLQLLEDDSSYTLIAGDNGIGGNPRGTDDSYVEIKFSDQHQVKLIFYQSRIVGCELSNG